MTEKKLYFQMIPRFKDAVMHLSNFFLFGVEVHILQLLYSIPLIHSHGREKNSNLITDAMLLPKQPCKFFINADKIVVDVPKITA